MVVPEWEPGSPEVGSKFLTAKAVKPGSILLTADSIRAGSKVGRTQNSNRNNSYPPAVPEKRPKSSPSAVYGTSRNLLLQGHQAPSGQPIFSLPSRPAMEHSRESRKWPSGRLGLKRPSGEYGEFPKSSWSPLKPLSRIGETPLNSENVHRGWRRNRPKPPMRPICVKCRSGLFAGFPQSAAYASWLVHAAPDSALAGVSGVARDPPLRALNASSGFHGYMR